MITIVLAAFVTVLSSGAVKEKGQTNTEISSVQSIGWPIKSQYLS
jgi:hypothetical protein